VFPKTALAVRSLKSDRSPLPHPPSITRAKAVNVGLRCADRLRSITIVEDFSPVSRLNDVILETRGLTKEFRGFTAVQGVDLKVRRGTIHALIGPNGAGKTTVFNLLTKFLDPSAGQIFFNGRDITALKPAEIARRGIVRSFQISAVFPHLSVRENVRVALQHKLGNSFHFWRSQRVLDHLDAPAETLLEAVGLAGLGDGMASELAYGRKRALEIATTLALDPEMLLLDEPMAGLGQEEIGRIAALIREVSADRTILMVEHNLSVVADLSHMITVLTRGRILTQGDYAAVSNDPEVVEAYLGTGHA
jgi:branched-chain amino acid transport system ATP-binding protein